jgi:multiple sugar transport system ATP-binding protein
MNFFAGTLGEGGARLQAGAFGFAVPAAARAATAPFAGKKVVAGIRPENVLPAGRPTRGEAAPVEATVDIVETLGDELVVHARAGEDVLVFKEDPHQAPEIGAKVALQLDLAALHLFDAGTEKRIA